MTYHTLSPGMSSAGCHGNAAGRAQCGSRLCCRQWISQDPHVAEQVPDVGGMCCTETGSGWLPQWPPISLFWGRMTRKEVGIPELSICAHVVARILFEAQCHFKFSFLTKIVHYLLWGYNHAFIFINIFWVGGKESIKHLPMLFSVLSF